MNYLYNHLFLFYLFINLLFPAQLIAQEDTYCNDRFNFCLQYPSEILTNKTYAANADGVVLYSEDRKLTVNISGINNPLNNSISQELMLFKEYLAKQKPAFTIQLARLESDQFSVLAVSKKEAYYYKTISTGTHMVNLSIATQNLTLEESQEAIENIKEKLIFLVYP